MDKRAKKLGYANAEEMREKYKNNEVSPWLLGVYTGNFVPPGKFYTIYFYENRLH